jgi:hypothetical protein
MKSELEVITMIAKLEKVHKDLYIEMSYAQNDYEGEDIQTRMNLNREKIEALEWVLESK